jgi:hypothetical protein
VAQRSIGLLAGLALTAAVAGCEKGPPAGAPLAEAYPVSGTIVFPNKTPLRGGIIFFTPTEVKAGGKIRYEGAGLVDARGQYKIGLNGDGAGVPAGDYKVTIKPRDYQELPNSNSNGIPKRYREPSETPLTVTVKEEPNTFDFVLQ